MGEGKREEVRTYRDLQVWQKARELVQDIYVISKNFPKEEIYGLTSQIRRAIVSVPSNIAEGHARRSTKEYINFISIASGSLAEVETQLFLAMDLCYASESEISSIMKKINILEKMLFSLRRSLELKI